MESKKCCMNGHYACQKCKEHVIKPMGNPLNPYNQHIVREQTKGGKWLEYRNGVRVIVPK